MKQALGDGERGIADPKNAGADLNSSGRKQFFPEVDRCADDNRHFVVARLHDLASVAEFLASGIAIRNIRRSIDMSDEVRVSESECVFGPMRVCGRVL